MKISKKTFFSSIFLPSILIITISCSKNQENISKSIPDYNSKDPQTFYNANKNEGPSLKEIAFIDGFDMHYFSTSSKTDLINSYSQIEKGNHSLEEKNLHKINVLFALNERFDFFSNMEKRSKSYFASEIKQMLDQNISSPELFAQIYPNIADEYTREERVKFRKQINSYFDREISRISKRKDLTFEDYNQSGGPKITESEFNKRKNKSLKLDNEELLKLKSNRIKDI